MEKASRIREATESAVESCAPAEDSNTENPFPVLVDPPDHYRLGPSSSDRWIPCPYSAQHELPPEVGEKPAASAGTIVHDASAKVLTDKISPFELECDVYEGVVPLLGKSKAKTLVEGALFYVDYVQSLFGTKYHEIKLEHPHIADFGGTLDTLVMSSETTAHIVDLKTGWWKVPAKDNTQLKCYSVLAAAYLPDVESFQVTIVQPQQRNPITHDTFTRQDVKQFEADVAFASTSTEKQTGDHCRFCPLRPACVEGQAYCLDKEWK